MQDVMVLIARGYYVEDVIGFGRALASVVLDS